MRPTARMPKLTRRSRILILIALGVIALLLAGPRLIDAYVDWLWFGELGYRSVFTTVLFTRLVVFLVAGVLVNIFSSVRHVRIVQALNNGEPIATKPSTLAIVVALALAAAGLAMAVYLTRELAAK